MNDFLNKGQDDLFRNFLNKEQDDLLNIWTYMNKIGLKETRTFVCDMSILDEFDEMFKEEKE